VCGLVVIVVVLFVVLRCVCVDEWGSSLFIWRCVPVFFSLPPNTPA
jgi:hypothetical protein